MRVKQLVGELEKTEHGFKHIVNAGEKLLADKSLNYFDIANTLITDTSYQARTLATYLLGRLWILSNHNALQLKAGMCENLQATHCATLGKNIKN